MTDRKLILDGESRETGWRLNIYLHTNQVAHQMRKTQRKVMTTRSVRSCSTNLASVPRNDGVAEKHLSSLHPRDPRKVDNEEWSARSK